MPNQYVEGGPITPVFIMNGAAGVAAPGGAAGASALGVSVPPNASATSGTKAVAGNNTLLPAPGAGNRIVVYWMILQNESANATTIQLIDVVARFRALLDQYRYYPVSDWRLNENTALTLNLSAANSIGYSIQYAIEPV